MKKSLIITLIAISMLALLATMAIAPNPTKSARLVGTYYAKNQLMVWFDVTGFTSKTSLASFTTIDQVKYNLSCKFDGVDKVICQAPNMKRFAGKPASIWLSGMIFYTKMPGK